MSEVAASNSPITHEYRLACSAEHAFSTYVERIAQWWHPRYTANPDTLEAVTIEPLVGGRVSATHSDIGRSAVAQTQIVEFLQSFSDDGASTIVDPYVVLGIK